MVCTGVLMLKSCLFPGSGTLQAGEERVRSDLDLIVRSLRDILRDSARAIFLIGGFGRGEGSVEAANGHLRLVSDYDLLVVTTGSAAWTRLRFRRPLAGLLRSLASQLEVKPIDVSLTDENRLRRYRPTLFNYEMLHGHQLLWGEFSLREAMPPYDATDLPLFEGTRLLFNRGSGLLLAFAKLPTDRDPTSLERQRFLIECFKAHQAIGDCFLLMHGSYDYRYSERLRRASCLPWQEAPNGKEILERYKSALEMRLRPRFADLSEVNLKNCWNETRQLYEGFYRFFETQRLGRPIPDWVSFASLDLEPSTRGNDKVAELWRNLSRLGLLRTVATGAFAPIEEKLMRVLPLLLFGYGTSEEKKHLGFCTYYLGLPRDTDFRELVLCYAARWHE